MLGMTERASLLRDMLTGVGNIALKYGFFYLVEGMVGYDEHNKVVVWFHTDVMINKRQYPINHSELS